MNPTNQTISQYDKSNLLGITYNFPDDATIALKNALKINIPDEYNQIKNIVISGMGGSCISGDLLKSYIYDKAEIPVIVNRSSVLPHFVNSESLSIFISYSGNTQETLKCAKESFKRGCKVIIITHGGEIQTLAKDNNAVCVLLTGQVKMPRAALGDLFYSLIGILSKIKNLNINLSDVEDSIKSLDEIRKKADLKHNSDNYLLQAAQNMVNKKIVVFGVSPFTEAIALRWKCQFNENSKEVVIHNSFPELTHNEIIGLTDKNIDLRNYYFIALRDQAEDSFLKKQIDTTLSFFENSTEVNNFVETGKSLLERQMRLIYLGDYLSIYLALLKGVDPTPIEAIMTLKEKMKES
ncbi:MAG: bifunctional phosphoglucose/phosphomannose isomerase [Candidatus Sericytochromatia bacterium]|nr:bifunctional phosphoglucose/phosphomannose isomerase [Candidatus Sericytochromatia bacterium]